MCLRTLACRLSPFALSFVAAATLASCGSSTPAPLGTEGAACYALGAGPDGGAARCNEGLTCQKMVCVRPGDGGTIIDTASEPVSDAADAQDGGVTGDAHPDAVSPDAGAPEAAADAAPSDAGDASDGGGIPDGGAAETPPPDGATDVPASVDGGSEVGDAGEAGADA